MDAHAKKFLGVVVALLIIGSIVIFAVPLPEQEVETSYVFSFLFPFLVVILAIITVIVSYKHFHEV